MPTQIKLPNLSVVEGVEDAADHPERPVHTHLDYGRPDNVPPLDSKQSMDQPLSARGLSESTADGDPIDVEDLSDEDTAVQNG